MVEKGEYFEVGDQVYYVYDETMRVYTIDRIDSPFGYRIRAVGGQEFDFCKIVKPWLLRPYDSFEYWVRETRAKETNANQSDTV